MAPPNLKNKQKDVASDASSLTSPSPSYDVGSESSTYSPLSNLSLSSTSHRSRRDSFNSSASSSRNSPRSIRRRRLSSGIRSRSSHSSGMSIGSNPSRKSILKKSRKISPYRRRSLSKTNKILPTKNKKKMRPVGEFSRIKNPAILKQVRAFISNYSEDPEFEAFTLSVDGIPFVALSLMNSDASLLERFKKGPEPPTPMKKHTTGGNSPRKRLHSRSSSKSVRFTDEGPMPKKTIKPSSADNEDSFRELVETVSDALSQFQKIYQFKFIIFTVENGRRNDDLWKDRAKSVER
ncbi:hypothetical protein CRE_01077 [Caenorhabditis remanei]|uniref:Uncharacterized protein n=1 Tax=Caenorhabditis remanei TaxID=31234 RepID=E3MIB9_CAERE|nr:hypothetical protein CRE_01077 [Caenorhabditis remanei]